MEKPGVLNFEVGQLAEMKTFEDGFRGAWFGCKIRDIILKENKIMPEYYEFPEEVVTWAEIYQVPPYGRKSKQIKRQLMVRPRYPLIYHKSQMSPLAKVSEVCVIIDGTWKAGDLVDWRQDDCYWSARVIEVLSSDKVKIRLPLPPAGEGGPIHEAFCADLRPSLGWSARKGWTLLTKGQASCSAELVFPWKQGMREEAAAGSPVNASLTSRISESSLLAEGVTSEKEGKMMDDDDVVESVTGKASSSDSISTLHVQGSKTDSWEEDIDYNVDLNIMHEDTLEAAILDLEELANRIKWVKSILESNRQPTSSWEFVEVEPPSPSPPTH